MPNRLLTATRSEIANRLLLAASKGYNASPVSVTVTGTGSNTSTLTGGGYSSGVDYRDPTKCLQVGGGLANTSTPVIYNNGGISFQTDAPIVDVWMRAGVWELYINGQPASGNPYTSAGDGFQKIDFGSLAMRTVEIRFKKLQLSSGGSIVVQKPYSILPSNSVSPIIPIIGDSLTEAVGYGTVTAPGQGFAMQIGRKANWDTIAMGVGGTGYTTSAPDDIGTRTAQLSNYPTADMVIFAGGINDNGATPSVVTAAVSAAVTNARVILPNALIVVNGPFRAPGRNPSQSISNAIKAGFDAVADSRMVFIDQYAQNWLYGSDNGVAGYQQSGNITFTAPISAATSGTLTSAWAGATNAAYTLVFGSGTTKTVTLTNGSTAVSWTGAISAGTSAYAFTANTGNSVNYHTNDTIHWNVPGHTYVEGREREAILTWLRSIV